jgi:hypothetical protein
MFEKDILALDLKPGDKINVWVRFRDEPYTGEFVEILAQIFFFNTNGNSKGTALREIAKVEKV